MRSNLRLCIDRVMTGASVRIPEAQRAIGCAAARRQQARLPRTEVDALDGCRVMIEREARRCAPAVPDAQ